MMRHILVAGAVLCAACGLASAEGHKLIFFGDSRPMVIEFQIETEGQSLNEAWNECVTKIFKHLDANDDGSLDKTEASRMPQPSVLFGGNGRPGLERQLAAFRVGGGQAPDMDADMNGKVTREEVTEFLLKNGGAPFRAEFGAQQQFSGRVVIVNGAVQGAGSASADAINAALYALLDADKDGKLSQEELKTAPDAMKKLDINDDEMVSLSELGINSGQQGVRFIAVDNAAATAARVAPPPVQATSSSFAAVTDKASREMLGQQLLKRYGAKDARSIVRKEIGLDVATFQKLDADKDDVLDAGELSAVADLPSDVVTKVRLGKKAEKDDAVEIVSEKGAKAVGAKVSTKNGLITLELGVSRLEVRLGGPAQDAGIRFAQDIEVMQFKNADVDGNGYLDEKEAMNNPLFRTSFKQMDRDNDGMLYEKEMKAYLGAIKDLQTAAKAGTAVLNVTDQGRGLFDLIDTKRDGNLGLRELREAAKLLGQLDRDGDTKLDKAEVPKSYQLNCNQGGGSGNGAIFAVAAPLGVATMPAPQETKEGPMWFRKMDRNRDGDLSRREFIGGETEFRHIDTDNDGLVSREEADKADAALRK